MTDLYILISFIFKMLGEKFKTYLPILVFIMCAFSCKENNRSSLLFDMEKVEGNYFISQNSKRFHENFHGKK